MEMSLDMARMAVADGITHMACTPHIVPGLYDNDARCIDEAMRALSRQLLENDIPLKLIIGADVHATPGLVERLVQKIVPTLGGTRYFLFEPPHHLKPPGLERLARELLTAGFIPVLTHPERLTWIESHYDTICELDDAGLIVQVTAGSVTGRFGSSAKYWSERLLDEGRVDIIASDAHNTKSRPPIMSRARDRIAKRLSDDAAQQMTLDNPLQMINDEILRNGNSATLIKPEA